MEVQFQQNFQTEVKFSSWSRILKLMGQMKIVVDSGDSKDKRARAINNFARRIW